MSLSSIKISISYVLLFKTINFESSKPNDILLSFNIVTTVIKILLYDIVLIIETFSYIVNLLVI